jgi:hypothetical protein
MDLAEQATDGLGVPSLCRLHCVDVAHDRRPPIVDLKGPANEELFGRHAGPVELFEVGHVGR